MLIGHRGGRKWAPENTLAAFGRCLNPDTRCDGIELDVQRCASGELVVMHDADVGRTTNGVGRVRDISLDELKRLSAGSWFDRQFAGERIPTLAEVLDLVDGNLTINVEVKNTPEPFEDIENDLLEELSSYRYKDKIIVSSFDHHLIKRLSVLDSTLKLAVLADALLVDLAAYAKKLGATYWHPCFDSINAAAIKTAHDAGLIVNVWTVSDSRTIAEATKMGVDGIVTDDPETMLEFKERLAVLNDSGFDLE